MEAIEADRKELNGLVAEIKNASEVIRAQNGEYKKMLDEHTDAIAELQHKSKFAAATPRLVDSAEYKSFGAFARKGGVMATNDNVTGGFLCVNEISSEIIRLAEADNVIRQLARKITIQGGSVDFPVEKDGDTIQWIGETEEKPSEPVKFQNVHCNVFDINRNVPVTNQLLDDAAFGVEQFIMEHIARIIAETEENSFLNGKGPKTVEGILNCDRIGSITSGTAGKITFDDIVDVTVANGGIARSKVREKAVLVMNPKTRQMLRKQKGTDGHYIMPPVSAGMPETLDGIPLYVSSFMPEPTSGAAAVLYGDLSGYTIVDRRDITIQRNPYKVSGQTLFEFWKREGGVVTDGSKLAKVVVQ